MLTDIDEAVALAGSSDSEKGEVLPSIGRHHPVIQALRAARGWVKRRREGTTASPAVLQVLNSMLYAVRDHDAVPVLGEPLKKRARSQGSVQMFTCRAILRAAFEKVFECAADVAKRFPQSNGKPASRKFIGDAKKAFAMVLHTEVKRFVT